MQYSSSVLSYHSVLSLQSQVIAYQRWIIWILLSQIKFSNKCSGAVPRFDYWFPWGPMTYFISSENQSLKMIVICSLTVRACVFSCLCVCLSSRDTHTHTHTHTPTHRSWRGNALFRSLGKRKEDISSNQHTHCSTPAPTYSRSRNRLWLLPMNTPTLQGLSIIFKFTFHAWRRKNIGWPPWLTTSSLKIFLV